MNSKYLTIITNAIGLIGTVSGAMIHQGDKLFGWIIMGVFLIIGSIGVFQLINGKFKFNDKKIDFTENNLFRKMDSHKLWIKNKLLVPTSKTKTIMAQDLLINVLNIYENVLEIFIEKYENVRPNTSNELITDIHYYINEIIAKITVYYQFNDTSYSETDKETLRIVIDKFLVWHGANLLALKNQISNMVLDIQSHPNSMDEKVSIILSYFDFLIILTLINSKTFLSKLNGQLKDKMFRGQKIGI